uniref:Glutathione transferase n=1 Tax=Erythrolobus madagascarensis TaxID=708628 RepID=A0A7S0T791_9RHOD|mmetsp:Transcript_3014/g.6499  ORF Transcript_3014/g.6499 Transcript_3014/m.6499 type:complete len:405 (+) Transcript_3014:70-1284(+)
MEEKGKQERVQDAVDQLCNALDILGLESSVQALDNGCLKRIAKSLAIDYDDVVDNDAWNGINHALVKRVLACGGSSSGGVGSREEEEDRSSKLTPETPERDEPTKTATQKQTPSAPAGVGDDAPSLPVGYKVPEVWNGVQGSGADGGIFGSQNRADADAREERELPVGDHKYQLYSIGTANGIRAAAMLEELGIEYDAWYIDIMKGDQFTTGLMQLNPNAKVPAMRVKNEDESESSFRVFESAHILLHLAETYPERGLVPADQAGRAECLNWLFWSASTTPVIGFGFGHFYRYGPIKIAYAIDRCTMELKRQLSVLDKQLTGRSFVVGESMTIADICIFPWMYALEAGYKAAKFLKLSEYKNVERWMASMLQRPAVQRGIRVNGFAPDAIRERHSPADFGDADN